jgi:hypothetical protein
MLSAWVVVLALGATPRVCQPVDANNNPWERAKQGQLRAYCGFLAKGEAKMASGAPGAAEALVLAERAAKLLPQVQAAYGLRARAEARLGNDVAALTTLDQHAAAIDDVAVRLLHARILAKQGQSVLALQRYAEVMVEASELDAPERARATFEYGWLRSQQGPSGLADARALFAEVERQGGDLASAASLAGALAASRMGEETTLQFSADALGAAATAGLAIVRAEKERDALDALMHDRAKKGSGRALWERYVATAGDRNPWSSHARARAAVPGDK